MANSTSRTEKSEPDMERRRKQKHPHTTEPTDESSDDFVVKDEEEYQNLSPHSTNAVGLKCKGKIHYCSESSDDVSSKKTKFTVRKFPLAKVCAVVQAASSQARQDEPGGRDLPTRLTKLKTAIENLSGDWDVIMRAPEIATIVALHEKFAERDEHISKSKEENAATNILHKEIEKKDADILELKADNAKLKEDLAREVVKVKEFEQWKGFMMSTFGLEASGAK